jgi:hypothetical protein
MYVDVYNIDMSHEDSDILGMEHSLRKKGLSEFRFELEEMPALPEMEVAPIKPKIEHIIIQQDGRTHNKHRRSSAKGKTSELF